MLPGTEADTPVEPPVAGDSAARPEVGDEPPAPGTSIRRRTSPTLHAPAVHRAILKTFIIASALTGTVIALIVLTTGEILSPTLLFVPFAIAGLSAWRLRHGGSSTPLVLVTLVILIGTTAVQQTVISFDRAGLGVVGLTMALALLSRSRAFAFGIAGLAIGVLTVLRWTWLDERFVELAASAMVPLVIIVFGVQLIEWAKREISGRETRFENLFDSVPVAIWEEDFTEVVRWLDGLRRRGVTDLRRYLEANPGEVRHGASLIDIKNVNDEVLGFLEAPDRKSLVGRLDPKLILEDTLEAMVEEFVAVWDGRSKLRFDVTGTTLLGNPIDGFLMMSAPTTPDGIDWSNVVVAMVDVSEQRATQRKLQDLIESKDRFVASVSHELRTPLAAVIGLAQELRLDPSGFTEEERNELVALIADQAIDVGGIVEDLLVAARADIGKVSIHAEPVALGKEVSTIVSTVEPQAGQSFEVDVSASVYVDPRRLRQILRNLVSNAHRYGGDVVSIDVATQNGVVALEVRDNGEGIPDELRNRVFEPYETAHERVGVTGSVGLGLTVSRQLARLMGGDLIYDQRDGWAVFRLTLPAA